MAGTNLDFGTHSGEPAFEILALFAQGNGHSGHALAELTGQSPAEAARRATMLTGLRLLDTGPDDLYRPGKLLRFNRLLGDDLALGEGSTGVLDALTGINGGSARIGILHDSGVSYLLKDGPSDRIGFTAAGSAPAPGSALGQVLLAHISDNAAAAGFAGQLPQVTGPTGPSTPEELELALSVVRLSGVAMTRGTSETLDVAVPVIGAAGRVEIAIEVRTSGFSDADAAVLDGLRQLAQRLSRAGS